MTGLVIAWCVTLVLLIALWIRFFPSAEEWRELGPAARLLMTINRPFIRMAEAAADLFVRGLQRIAPAWMPEDPLTLREDLPARKPGAPPRVSALSRIRAMNGDSAGGVSLAAPDASRGALTLEGEAGALSVAEEPGVPGRTDSREKPPKAG